jgi:hypothetical protein
VTIHAIPGAATVAACSRLFRSYPLAVTPRSADGGPRSMVLMNRTGGAPAFFVITQAGDNLFVIRSWDRRDELDQGIWSGEPVSAAIGQLVTGGMPVPRDGALLGWLTDSQVTVLLTVHCRPPEPWDDPDPGPRIQVMPLAGTTNLLHWPPFTASPLDGRLWDYVERGQIVDIAPLLTHSGGRAFWVPSPDTPGPHHDNPHHDNPRHDKGCIVVTGNLSAEEYWLPAGVYLDHWTLREGIPAPPVGQLLIQPDVVELTRELW